MDSAGGLPARARFVLSWAGIASGLAFMPAAALPNQPITMGSASVFVPAGGSAGAMGDFNGDGRTDAAFAHTAISYRNADGSFASPIAFSHSAAVGIASGDFDSNGRTDLVVARMGVVDRQGSVTLLLNHGFDYFTSTDHPINATASGCAVGDFNGDARPDVAVSENGSGGGLCVFPGEPGVPLGTRQDIALGAYTYEIAAGDFDRDGLDDVALLAYIPATKTHSIRVFFGIHASPPLIEGAGYAIPTLGRPLYTPLPTSLAVGDIDGDGWQDLVLVSYISDTQQGLTVYLNAHDRAFVPRPIRPLITHVNEIAAGDLNGDHKADVVTANPSDLSFSIFLAAANGDLLSPYTFPATQVPTDVVLGYVDGDQLLDILISDASGPSKVFLNQGDFPTPIQSTLVRAHASADRVDLTWWTGDASIWTVRVERRQSSGEWTRLGPAVVTGDLASYHDESVVAGERYAYRLIVSSGAREEALPETWIDVPAASAFELEAVRPNPSSSSERLVFQLTDSRPARIEVLDVSGRVRYRREVGSFGAGRHVIALDRPEMAPGLYVVRLVRERDTRARTFTLIR